MKDLLMNPQFWSVVTPGLLIPVIKYYSEKSKEKTEKQNDKTIERLDKIDAKLESQGQATKNIIRYRLIKNMRHAIRRGYTSSSELQEMCNLYDSYHELGGNGTVDKVYNDFINLKIDDERGIEND